MSPFQRFPHLFHSLSNDEQLLVAKLWEEMTFGNENVSMLLRRYVEDLLRPSVQIDFSAVAPAEQSERCLEYLMVGLKLKICNKIDVGAVVGITCH